MEIHSLDQFLFYLIDNASLITVVPKKVYFSFQYATKLLISIIESLPHTKDLCSQATS